MRTVCKSNASSSAIWIGLILGIAVFGSPLAFAQLPTGAISGVVRDSSGAVIPAATITAINRENGLTRTAQTDTDGRFKFPALPVGVYDVRAEAPAFQAEVQAGLNLAVGQEAVLNFALTVGAVQETVTVTAAPPLVETTNGSLGGLVNEQRVSDLPLNGRNFNELVLLQTGISVHHPAAATAFPATGLDFSSNGAPIRSNYIMLDGADLLGSWGLTGVSVSGSMLGIEGIREFRVITNSFPAEYGMTMGSQTTIASKGGTNQFHGSVFEFLRNSALDARNFFDRKLHPNDPRIPAFRRNNLGGSLGGPVRTDKSFFFVTYEGVRESLGITEVLNVPTAAARQDGVLVPKVAESVKPYLNLYPLPTEPLANDLTGASGVGRFTYAFNRPTREDYGQVRADQNFSDRDNAFLRYTVDDTSRIIPIGFPQFTELQNSRGQFITLAENHTFSPALLNLLRFSFSRPFQDLFDPSISNLGFVPGLPMGIIAPGSGITGIGPRVSAIQQHKQNLFTLSDDLFRSRGAHAVKFGTLLNHYRDFETAAIHNFGTYFFSNLPRFLSGNPRQLTILTPGSVTDRTYRWNTFGFYVQDDWRMASNLTLNVGMRYEFNTTVNEVSGKGSSVRDLLHDAKPTLGPAAYENPSLRNFGPRLGFAWDVFGNSTTSVRGGFGLLYDIANVGTSLAVSAGSLPPFSSNTTLTANLSFPHPIIPPEAAGKSIRLVDFHLQQPHMLQYNLTVERKLLASTAVSIAYAGSRGINIMEVKQGNPTWPSAQVNGRDFWTGGEQRSNPNWESVLLATAGGDSWYNSLQVSVQKRLSHGLQFQSSYTWSKLLDTTQGQVGGESGGTSIVGTDPNHPKTDKGPADFDTRHSFAFNTLYQLPSPGLHGVGRVLDGWRLGSILTLKSGLPFSAFLSGNHSRTGVLVGADRPDLVPGRKPGDIILGGPDRYFDPSAFQIPPIGTLGTASRNFLQGPGQASWDFSLTKATSLPFLGETGRLEFRAEIFNLLNRANFNIPTTGRTVFTADETRAITTPLSTAGQIDRTVSSSRQIQFALKLVF